MLSRKTAVSVVFLAMFAGFSSPSFAQQPKDVRLVQKTDAQLMALVERMTTFPEQLNQKIWNGMAIRSEVKERAVAFSRELFKELGVEGLKIRDVLLLGSNASFEYDSGSDVDIHILIDSTAFTGGKKTLDAYLNAINDVNEDKYGSITFYGFPVDFAFYAKSVESRLDPGVGVYSFGRDKWLNVPKASPARFSRGAIFADAKGYIGKYNAVASAYAKQKIGFACTDFTTLREDMRQYRKVGMVGTGIRSTANVTYRLMRRLDFNVLREIERLHSECTNLNISLH